MVIFTVSAGIVRLNGRIQFKLAAKVLSGVSGVLYGLHCGYNMASFVSLSGQYLDRDGSELVLTVTLGLEHSHLVLSLD